MTRREKTTAPTTAQRKLLVTMIEEHLVIYQEWETGKCYFVPDIHKVKVWGTKAFGKQINKKFIATMHDLNLIETDGGGPRFHNNKTFYMVVPSDEGKKAVEEYLK